jgi:hypothetical protein
MAIEYTPAIQEKIVKILTAIIEKANSDEEFGKLCLNDFPSAFKKATGSDLPAGASFECVQLEGRIVLKAPTADADELTDEDLESVAGGTGFGFPILEALSLLFGPIGPSVGPPSLFGPVGPVYGAPGPWININPTPGGLVNW